MYTDVLKVDGLILRASNSAGIGYAGYQAYD